VVDIGWVKITNEYDIVKFWELAFEKQSKQNTGIFTVRSFIFEELVNELNAIIDTYMDQLTTSGHKLSVTLTSDLVRLIKYLGKRCTTNVTTGHD